MQRKLTHFFHPSSSVVTGKEVFASGDKIMVSVNFKQTSASKKASKKAKVVANLPADSSSSANVERAKAKKPALVIDIMSSPYQVIK